MIAVLTINILKISQFWANFDEFSGFHSMKLDVFLPDHLGSISGQKTENNQKF